MQLQWATIASAPEARASACWRAVALGRASAAVSAAIRREGLGGRHEPRLSHIANALTPVNYGD